ncbi:MAG: protein-L-isoaspartate O-methyltransferase [Pseudomonadota bacterium]|nr:protein-L-isoaspartate O-methyltransferase [Pseudomonadota bacterium]MDP1905886.1 protein-L-isoaspartate O-methyltransferase [Pseudomonadota bacterium]MDP2351758.1 protein-L-isoaspartate O-methyltransferase [Pseudomonadota bacterium]
MDYEQARFNMIEQQIRPWEVLDPKVLDLLMKVKREDFVPALYQSLAFVDMGIPLGHGEYMWAPVIEARALQAVQVKATDRVLEIGTGSGYFTALLASQAANVVSVEIHADLRDEADKKFHAHGYTHIQTRQGDGARDWQLDGHFDVIVLTGSVPLLPEAYLKRLSPGGRLFAIVGEGPAMAATLITRMAPGAQRTDILFETVAKSLANAVEPERFVF